MGKHIIEKIKENKRIIDDALNYEFSVLLKDSARLHPTYNEFVKELMEFTMRGGKRIRPFFCVTGFRCMSESFNPEINKAASSLELLESFLLIHDDIIDQDHMRRGGPTYHIMIADKYKQDFDTMASPYGNSVAIIAGDVAYGLSCLILQSTKFPEDLKHHAIMVLNDTVIKTCIGQRIDLELGIKKDATLQDIMDVTKFKTAHYTIEAPLHIGAILAGAKDSDLKILSDFAIPMGQAFQIQDDILGIFGDEKKLGKPVGSDIREGKKTILIVKALEKADARQKARMNELLGSRKLTDSDIKEFQEIIKNTGALDEANKLAVELVNQAKEAIIKSDFNEEGKNDLLEISEFLINRKH